MKLKGLSAALTLVVASAVLIVVALIVISMTSGGLGKFFKGTEDIAQAKVSACKSCVYSVCSTNPGGDTRISEIARNQCESVCEENQISCGSPSTCRDLILGGESLSCSAR